MRNDNLTTSQINRKYPIMYRVSNVRARSLYAFEYVAFALF